MKQVIEIRNAKCFNRGVVSYVVHCDFIKQQWATSPKIEYAIDYSSFPSHYIDEVLYTIKHSFRLDNAEIKLVEI